MAIDPISAATLALGAGGFLQGLFGGRKSYLDDPAIQNLLKRYEGLTRETGATAELERYFKPARAQVTRQITALGPPGASGAVSGALAELSGQEATAKTDLMREAAEKLLNLKLGLAQSSQPQGPQIDFGGLAAALNYYQYLKGLRKQPLGGEGAFPSESFKSSFNLNLPNFG